MQRIGESATCRTAIEKCNLFLGLSDVSLAKLTKLAKLRRYASGETIFRQGEASPGIFVVQTGLVRVFRLGGDGTQHVLHLVRPYQSFAEVAVFGQFDLPASAIAVEASDCVYIENEPFQHLLETDHATCRQMLAGMAFWTRHFTGMLDNIVMGDAQDRVANYLRTLPLSSDGYVQLPGSKKDIANHLNLSSETFSRSLRRLSDAGIIDFDPDRRIRMR